MQINEFGQTPRQLFKIPHPRRSPPEEEDKAASKSWHSEYIARKAPGEVSEYSQHRSKVSSLQLLDSRIVSTGHDGCIKILGLEKKQKRTFSVCQLALTCSSRISDKQVVVGSYDNKLYLFNLDNGRTSNSFKAHEDAITCCEYLEGLNAVCSGSWDSHIKVWDLRSSQAIHEFDDHEEQISAMGIDSSDSYKIISGDIDGFIVVRDLRKGVVSHFQGPGGVKDLKYTSFNRHIIASLPDEIGVYEESGNMVHQLDVEGVGCLESDGLFVLGGKEEEGLELWELMNGKCVYKWEGINRVTALAAHPTAEAFLAGNADGNIYYIR